MNRALLALLVGFATLTFAPGARSEELDDDEMLRFLVQAQCLDDTGRPTSSTPVEPGCVLRRAQLPSDPATYRKNDWGDVRTPAARTYGYQASDSVLSRPPRRAGAPVTVAQTFDFGSAGGEGFGAFQVALGDGGDVMTLEKGVASIFMTQDGGGGLQWFVGEGCRTGRATPDRAWLAFGRNTGRGAWSEDIARLVIAKDRRTCPRNFDTAYTRWTRADIAAPFLRLGAPIGVFTVDAIVSEHYDQSSIAASNHLERFFFGHDLGKIRWERWEHPRAPDPVIEERAREMAASARCPRMNYSDAPGPDWRMIDCRQWTNIVPPPADWLVEDFAWIGLTAAAR